MQQVSITESGSGRYLLGGDLVYETVPDFVPVAEKALDFSSDTEIDLSGVGLVNSAGIALFIDWFSHFRKQHGQLRFSNISEHLKQLVDVAGLEGLFYA